MVVERGFLCPARGICEHTRLSHHCMKLAVVYAQSAAVQPHLVVYGDVFVLISVHVQFLAEARAPDAISPEWRSRIAQSAPRLRATSQCGLSGANRIGAMCGIGGMAKVV